MIICSHYTAVELKRKMFFLAFGMVYSKRIFVVYFDGFLVNGSRLSCPASHVYYAVCHFLLSGITETQNSFFIIENTEGTERLIFCFSETQSFIRDRAD